MILFAHLVALAGYLGAALLAATPFLRPIGAPVRGVVALLGVGVAAHAAGLAAFSFEVAQLPFTGLGPSLSTAGLVLAATLLLAELGAREVSLTLVAAPLAALSTIAALIIELQPGSDPVTARNGWLAAHIALSFVGLAAFATAGAAGAMYLLERRELKGRRFGAIIRFFPPLATLDRVNHVAALSGWVVLTIGIVLSGAYSMAFRDSDALKLTWGAGAWMATTTVALGRVIGGWQARRAAVVSAGACAVILVLYVAFRALVAGQGRFL
jgi:ABC-type uncharacterized transport system permease subunit